MSKDPTWHVSDTNEVCYPEPTVITIDENTDITQIGASLSKQKIRRQLVGMEVFCSTDEFINWQMEEPREIYEITPQAVHGNYIKIFVTYNAGVID